MTTILSPLKAILPKKPGQRQFWQDLHGAAESLAIYSCAKNADTFVTVITPDSLSANKLRFELQFFAEEDAALPVVSFPDWEILPYDQFSPHQDIISERLLTLYSLPQLKKGILIVPINTLMHYTTARDYVESSTFLLKKGDELDLVAFQRRLERSGYRHVSQVMEHGEFSVRGSLIDIFPMGSPNPYRIDLFDVEVDSIRTFETETQRSIDVIDAIELLPAREFPLTEQSITIFRQAWRMQFNGDPTRSPLYQSITKGQFASGIEYYLTLFFEKKHTLFDFLESHSVILQLGNVEQKATQFWEEVCQRHEQLAYDIERPILPPKEIVLPVNEIFAKLKVFPQVIIKTTPESTAHSIHFASIVPHEFKVDSKAEQPLSALKTYLADTHNRVLICAETLGRREAILTLLADSQITAPPISGWSTFLASNQQVAITVANLDRGMMLTDPEITVISESQFFGQQVMQRRLRTKAAHDPENIIRDLAELKVGAPVVHISHGVGKYLGLQIIDTGDFSAEYLTIEYAEGDKLYVPISALHLIARYTGRDDEHAPIYQLGTKKWEKIKQKTAEKIRDVAAELLDVYARREARKGHSFTAPNHHYLTFASEFPFEETPDQLRAIDEVIKDMTTARPMDRLVCGDVGFGKTEVAMRSAFVAVQDNKQVCVLVPTTLLAQQHYQSFCDRFANWPIRVAVLSRFQSKKEQTTTIEEIREGKIDIVIGTHKLIQGDLQFRDLGLLIIDEEHRFGVQQKEKIKTLKSEVDILTLTATPIPRTLNLSLTGVRDLSIIATPPARRLAVKTFVQEYNSHIIREAVLREILRGGQVYFLHNEVRTIAETAERIAHLIPEATVNFAHGQMTERNLEKIMTDFYHTRFNVLVCSTIIESGIDIPTANTIIINRANHFGLAELHQLRGRVGRSHHQAYAYLLTPPIKAMTTDAIKRLEAIESLEDLGAGFMLATYDLEIRGAGEILGEDQSGFIEEVGFHMYTEMLDSAVTALKAGKEPDLLDPLKAGCEVDFRITALIPENYLPDVHVRLSLYKRIASCKNSAMLHDIQVEMVDRFGLLPPPLKNLFAITELKLACTPLGIKKIEVASDRGRIEFETEPKIHLPGLLNLIQKQPKLYQLDGSRGIKFKITETTHEAKIKLVQQLLKILTPPQQ